MPCEWNNKRYKIQYAKLNERGKLQVFEEDFTSCKELQSKAHIPHANEITRERLRRLIQWQDAEGVWHIGAKEKMRREFSHIVLTRNSPPAPYR